MAQVSYGTITITDTNDIERIYTVYAKSNTNTDVPTAAASSWKELVSEAPGTGNYIWQRTVVQKSGTQEKVYSDPVCLTGEEGTDGKGITSITIKYGTSADWNTQPSSWYDNTPEYSSSTPNYWTQTTINYTSGNPTVKVTQDKALTQAIYDSVMANSIAQSANENANGAMSQANNNINSVIRLWQAKSVHETPTAPSSEITTGSASTYGNWSTVKPTATDTYRYFYYCDQSKTGGGVCSWSEVIEDTSYLSTYEINSLNVRTKNFFKGLDNSYDGWFASGRTENEGLAANNAETYHYNARVAATHIALGYNKTPIIDLDGSSGAINIYRFPIINSNTGLVTIAGALGMKLNATDLIFYKPPVGNNSPVAAATLNANGLVLSEGGIKAGTSRTNGFIYLSSANFADTISGHSAGTVSLDNYTATDWRQLIGTKFGVRADGTLYANNAVISGTITVGSGSTIDSGATIGGTSASTVVNNAATGAQASSDLSDFQTTVANTYATQSELSDVEGQIPSDINELSDTDGIIPNDLSQLTDTTNIISGAVSTGVAGKADKIEAVYRTQRIYYRKTSSGAPDENTTWLTSSGTGYGNWSLKIPQLTSGSTKYPYLYTAVQTQTISQYNSSATTNNCTCSTVLLDDSTTVIDGGTIITGSIAANRLDVYDASINKISASAIDVASIQIGQSQVNNLTTELGNKANSSDSNWLVMITTTGIPDYVTPSVTLKATFYHGGTKATSGFGTPVWTKNGTTTLSGATFSNGESTITVTDIDAFYTCTISSN